MLKGRRELESFLMIIYVPLLLKPIVKGKYTAYIRKYERL